MRLFGLSKKDIDLLKSIFEKYFSEEQDLKIYLFGSRATGKFKEFSDIDIAIKSKKNLGNLLFKIQSELEDSDLPYKVDLLNWNNIAKEYLPGIRIQKKLFWTPKEIERKSNWRICPIGEHWTRTHSYSTKKGKQAIQSGHCKKNPSGKDVLKKDEIELFPSMDKFRKQKNKVLSFDLGFEKGNDYDELIAGWVAYWNEVFQLSPPLDANWVKVLVASESGFRENIITPNKNKNIGKAIGITQLTESTIRLLKNKNGEIKDHYVEMTVSEALDPNINIAGSVRWLFRKYETAKKRLKRVPSWEEVLWEYKGITKDNSKESLKIKNKIKEYCLKFNLPSQHH